MKNFFDHYLPVFEIVCRLLGNNWRVNIIDECEYRIKLTSPHFKNYSIHIRSENNRLAIIGSVDCSYWRSPCHKCTVSLKRNPVDIAGDIQRKILFSAQEEILTAQKYTEEKNNKKEHDKIVIGMLSRIVEITPYYNYLTGFKTKNGIHGAINENYSGYGIEFDGLDTEQLIKLVGFLSEL
ncbi:hypothetical protein [Escherichia coli]|uniref:hypothetical protein n=1 Tax=Escherichia coli TaxID=562 RepID=UPI00292B25F8|nr:hypothetical protein [Salmonella enterica]ELT0036108.1 hypothetical protein [Salmonella enterica]